MHWSHGVHPGHALNQGKQKRGGTRLKQGGRVSSEKPMRLQDEILFLGMPSDRPNPDAKVCQTIHAFERTLPDLENQGQNLRHLLLWMSDGAHSPEAGDTWHPKAKISHLQQEVRA